MNRLLSIFAFRHQPDRGALSAYLDGELKPARTAALEAHVAACAACASALEGLRDVRAALRDLPRAQPPRSFRLRPADVAAPAAATTRAVPAPPLALMRAMPVLSAAAIIVFAVAITIDASGGGSGTSERGAAPLSANAPPGASESYATNSDAARDGGTQADGGASAPPGPSGGAASGGEDAVATPAAGPEGEAITGGQRGAGGQAGVKATSASDRDDGNNWTLRIVELASAAVAIGAAILALRAWRQRKEEAA